MDNANMALSFPMDENEVVALSGGSVLLLCRKPGGGQHATTSSAEIITYDP